MSRPAKFLIACCVLVLASVLAAQPAPQRDPLQSWYDGRSKQAIVAFVTAAVKRGDPGYIAPANRIATFDNDGTLWAEQPSYFQGMFAIDQVKAMASQHPEWKDTQPFKAILEGDMKALAATGEKGIVEMLMATHAGMTTEEFSQTVADWLRTARHPRFKRPYSDLTYVPMIELLGYLRANGFKTFIVSGGGIEFMRVFAERVYGIPPDQIVGSTISTKFEMKDGTPVLVREPKIDFIDDGPGKPVGINKFIGKRPVFAFGNSDGDLQMLQWATAGPGPRFAGIVHHTDADREWAYDRDSSIGRLDKAWDEGKTKGWTIVDMKSEWKTVFKATPP